MNKELERPECEWGYTHDQIVRITGAHYKDFVKYMWGQTMSLCPEHGGVTYEWDLQRFFDGLPVID